MQAHKERSPTYGQTHSRGGTKGAHLVSMEKGAGQLLTFTGKGRQLQSIGPSLLAREGRAAARHPEEEASSGAQYQKEGTSAIHPVTMEPLTKARRLPNARQGESRRISMAARIPRIHMVVCALDTSRSTAGGGSKSACPSLCICSAPQQVASH